MVGRTTVGRMAAAAAVAGNLMVETGCTAACRPHRAGVYVPAQGPRHPSKWLGGRNSSELAGCNNNNWLAGRIKNWIARFVASEFQRSNH